MKKARKTRRRVGRLMVYMMSFLLCAVGLCVVLLGMMSKEETTRYTTTKQEMNMYVYRNYTNSRPLAIDRFLEVKRRQVYQKKSETKVLRYYLSQEEIELFAKIVYAEAGTSTYECQVAVAATILNRMDHPNYSDNLYEVIFEPGQFEPAQNGEIYTGRGENKTLVTNEMLVTERSNAQKAVYAALEGEDPTKAPLMAMGEEGGALFFFQPEALSDAQLRERCGIKNFTRIGSEIFYRTWD